MCIGSEDQCCHILSWWAFILFADASLTVDNVTKVMEMVTADMIMKLWGEIECSRITGENNNWKLLNNKGEDTSMCGPLYTSTVTLMSLHRKVLPVYYTSVMRWLQQGKQNHSIIKMVSDVVLKLECWRHIHCNITCTVPH